jgi:hypothetical protein
MVTIQTSWGYKQLKITNFSGLQTSQIYKCLWVTNVSGLQSSWTQTSVSRLSTNVSWQQSCLNLSISTFKSIHMPRFSRHCAFIIVSNVHLPKDSYHCSKKGSNVSLKSLHMKLGSGNYQLSNLGSLRNFKASPKVKL